MRAGAILGWAMRSMIARAASLPIFTPSTRTNPPVAPLERMVGKGAADFLMGDDQALFGPRFVTGQAQQQLVAGG